MDRKRIGQMLTNIITNAVKGDGVEVSVQDFGISIPAEVKEKIFERYFRVATRQ